MNATRIRFAALLFLLIRCFTAARFHSLTLRALARHTRLRFVLFYESPLPVKSVDRSPILLFELQRVA